MKFTGIKNSFLYISTMFLSVKLCYCISIERALRDTIYFNNTSSCSYVENSNVTNNACKCTGVEDKGVSIVSTLSDIACLQDKVFKESKNIYLVHLVLLSISFLDKNCKFVFCYYSNRKFISFYGMYEA